MFFVYVIFFTLLSFFVQIFVMKRKTHYEKRAEKYLPRLDLDIKTEDQTNTKVMKRNHLKEIVLYFSKVFVGRRMTVKWKRKLEQSNLQVKPEEFLAWRLIICVLAIIVGFLLNVLIMAILLVFVAFLIPTAFVDRKIRKRLAASEKQLPQALGTMASAMKSGFSFLQAMQLVGKEIQDPIGTEFNRTIRQINLGVSMEDSFKQLLDRLPNQDMELMVNAILIQRTTGGNLTDILEVMQETLRERVRFREELKALTAQGKMSALVISLLPLGVAFLLNIMDPTYFIPMLQHPLGWALIVGGIFSGFMGWIMIQKIVKIEV